MFGAPAPGAGHAGPDRFALVVGPPGKNRNKKSLVRALDKLCGRAHTGLVNEDKRYYAEKTGITRTYAVRDRITGRIVDTTGTYNSARRRATQMNEARFPERNAS